MNSFRIIVLILLTFVFGWSCKSKAPKDSHGLPLASQWILETIEHPYFKSKPISKISFINISKEINNFSGNGGCNSISGQLKVDNNQIKFSNIIATEMACDHLTQEQIFIQYLEKSNKYVIQGGQITLFENNTKLMTLESYR